jgi:hypothetical protein
MNADIIDLDAYRAKRFAAALGNPKPGRSHRVSAPSVRRRPAPFPWRELVLAVVCELAAWRWLP